MITALASIIVAISISITSFVQTLTLSGFKIIDCCGSKCVQDDTTKPANPSSTALELFWLLLFELGDHCIIICQGSFVCWFVSHTSHLLLLLLCRCFALFRRAHTSVCLNGLAFLGGIAFDSYWICTRHLFVRCFVCCLPWPDIFFTEHSASPLRSALVLESSTVATQTGCCWMTQVGSVGQVGLPNRAVVFSFHNQCTHSGCECTCSVAQRAESQQPLPHIS